MNNIVAENNTNATEQAQNDVSEPSITVANSETIVDLESLTEEKVLSMTEEEISEVKAQVQALITKADTVNGYLKALAWKAFKAKFTWANFKTLISSAWAKLKSWLSNLDPIFRYAIYALILAKLFNLI